MRTEELTAILERNSTQELLLKYDDMAPELQEELFQEAMCSNKIRAAYESMDKIGDEKFIRRMVVRQYLENGGPSAAFPPLILPGMTDNKFPIPNIVSNASLFGVRASNETDRPMIKKAEIYTREGCSIQYTGERLYQSDQDLLLVLQNLSRDGLGKAYSVPVSKILKQLNLCKSGENYKWVFETIERLRVGVVSFETFSDYGYCIGKKPLTKNNRRTLSKDFLNLVRDCHLDYETKKLVFQLDPRLIFLFGNNEYGLVSIEHRNALGKSDLAKLLQGLFASQKANSQYHRLDKIKALSGLKCSDRRFKKTLTDALKRLRNVGVISAFWMPRAYDASFCIWKADYPERGVHSEKPGIFYGPVSVSGAESLPMIIGGSSMS